MFGHGPATLRQFYVDRLQWPPIGRNYVGCLFEASKVENPHGRPLQTIKIKLAHGAKIIGTVANCKNKIQEKLTVLTV